MCLVNVELMTQEATCSETISNLDGRKDNCHLQLLFRRRKHLWQKRDFGKIHQLLLNLNRVNR